MDKTVDEINQESLNRVLQRGKKKSRSYKSIRLSKQAQTKDNLEEESNDHSSVFSEETAGESSSETDSQRESPDNEKHSSDVHDASLLSTRESGVSQSFKRDPDVVPQAESKMGDPVTLDVPDPGDYFSVYRLDGKTLVVFSLEENLDDFTAPILGAICQELINSNKKEKRIVFDFTQTTDLSTSVLGTLIRFKNTVVHLGIEICLVASPQVKSQLESSHLSRVLEVIPSIYPLICPSVRLIDNTGKSNIRKRGRLHRSLAWIQARLRFWIPLAICLLSIHSPRVLGSSGGQLHRYNFPSLPELETQLQFAPDLLIIELEIEQEKRSQGWLNRINFRANYSQHFSSAVPFVPTPELAVAGGTFVGFSISLPLAELLRKPTARDLNIAIKRQEYRRLYESKLAQLRNLFYQRDQQITHLGSLRSSLRTASLKQERVQDGLIFMEILPKPLTIFTPIDEAESDEGVNRISTQIDQVLSEIRIIETQIYGLLGKGAEIR